MKFRTTQREIKNGHQNVIAVSYCGLQTLLQYENPVAYTTRREGWGADIYSFGNTAITTGYAPFGSIRVGYDLARKYETAAQKIDSAKYDIKEMQAKRRELIDQLIVELTQKVN